MPEGKGYGPQYTSSVGRSLNYVGKHVYAYSGAHAGNTTPVTALEFTTGSSYIKGVFEIQIALANNSSSNTVSMSNLKFNSELVANLVAGYKGADGITWQPFNAIIPPYTKVTANLFSDEDQAERFMTMSFTGKVYGKVD